MVAPSVSVASVQPSVVSERRLGAVGAGNGAVGAGAGAVGAWVGALGAGASTFFSFRRMNAACFTIFCAPDPPGGRTFATGAPWAELGSAAGRTDAGSAKSDSSRNGAPTPTC